MSGVRYYLANCTLSKIHCKEFSHHPPLFNIRSVLTKLGECLTGMSNMLFKMLNNLHGIDEKKEIYFSKIHKKLKIKKKLTVFLQSGKLTDF